MVTLDDLIWLPTNEEDKRLTDDHVRKQPFTRDEVEGEFGIRSQITGCRWLDSVVPGLKGLALKDCLYRMENTSRGPVDSLGIDWKASQLTIQLADAISGWNMWVPKKLGAVYYAQTLVLEKAKTCFVGWLYANQVPGLGVSNGQKWDVPIYRLNPPSDLLKIFKLHYPDIIP